MILANQAVALIERYEGNVVYPFLRGKNEVVHFALPPYTAIDLAKSLHNRAQHLRCQMIPLAALRCDDSAGFWRGLSLLLPFQHFFACRF